MGITKWDSIGTIENRERLKILKSAQDFLEGLRI